MKKDYAIIPFNTTTIKNKYLVSNVMGAWDFLDRKELTQLRSFRIERNNPLFKRLYERGLVIDANNMQKAINDYRNLNVNLLNDTSLHIAVLTTRCNLRCRYCQTTRFKEEDMNHEVATRVLKYLFDVRVNDITLEFQGGEPLLNWPILEYLVSYSRKFNSTGKNLKIALVSNLLPLDDGKIKFLTRHDVEICTSLDGPRHIHDKNRVLLNGRGTYEAVVKNIKKLKETHKAYVNCLPTITKHSLKQYKAVIDEYVRLGIGEISLRPVNRLGVACANWTNLGYTPQEFITFYKNALEYILTLNKKGIYIRERTTRVILEKILNKRDPVFVDMMNPCGTGRSNIVYMPDGSCYPCDEARMLGEEMFKLGNILNENYEDLMKKENLLHLLEASLVNLWDYNSAFSPWIGTCPVVNYSLQKNIVPKIWCSPMHQIYTAQFRFVFEKILEDKESETIFRKWIKGGVS